VESEQLMSDEYNTILLAS